MKQTENKHLEKIEAKLQKRWIKELKNKTKSGRTSRRAKIPIGMKS